MARAGKYKIPKPFKDEDIWLRWFTKEQLLYIAVAALLSAGVIYLFYMIRLTLIGATIAVILMFAGFAIPRFNMPDDKYLLGGGMPLKVVIGRIIVKKFVEKKKLYVTDFNVAEDE